MGVPLQIAGIGLLYALSIALGIVLSHSGRPLNVVLSAFHKLVSLGAIACAVILFADALKTVQAGVPLVALLAAAGVLNLGLIATGAILSGPKANRTLRLAHSLMTALAVLSIAGAVYVADII